MNQLDTSKESEMSKKTGMKPIERSQMGKKTPYGRVVGVMNTLGERQYLIVDTKGAVGNTET